MPFWTSFKFENVNSVFPFLLTLKQNDWPPFPFRFYLSHCLAQGHGGPLLDVPITFRLGCG